MKRIESLLYIAGMKFEFENLEIGFHKQNHYGEKGRDVMNALG